MKLLSRYLLNGGLTLLLLTSMEAYALYYVKCVGVQSDLVGFTSDSSNNRYSINLPLDSSGKAQPSSVLSFTEAPAWYDKVPSRWKNGAFISRWDDGKIIALKSRAEWSQNSDGWVYLPNPTVWNSQYNSYNSKEYPVGRPQANQMDYAIDPSGNRNNYLSDCLNVLKYNTSEFVSNQIVPMAQEGSFTKQISILNNTIGNDSLLSNASNMSLDYDKLKRYAYVSNLSYLIEKDANGTTNPEPSLSLEPKFSVFPSAKLIASMQNLGIAKAYGVAVMFDDDRSIVIGYKGTQNNADYVTDAQLMAMNMTDGANLTSYINYAYSFYKTIKDKYPNNKIILTGHSLGAFIATMVSIKSGEVARVFSSPANYIATSNWSIYSGYGNNYLPIENVINFSIINDPVVYASARHVTSTVYFPTRSTTPLDLVNHSIQRFYEAFDAKTIPSHVYLIPGTQVGYGFKSPSSLIDSFTASKVLSQFIFYGPTK